MDGASLNFLDVGATLAPFAALIWAIYAFYGARKADRDDELRRERQTVYRDYWASLEELKRDHQLVWINNLRVMSALGPHHETISLIAPDEVASASLAYINAHIGDDFFFEGRPLKEKLKPGERISKEEQKARTAAIMITSKARRKLLLAMRSDLLRGTKVDPSLSSIDDLKGD